MSDEWFSEKRAPDGKTEDGCHPDEAQALKAYLQGSLTPSEAAYDITRPIASAKDKDSDLPRLWCLLIDALIELPESNIPALFRLLEAIQRLPETELEDQPSYTHGSKTLWRNLHGFGHEWSDELKQDNWRKIIKASTPEEREELGAAYIKQASIEAWMVGWGIGAFPLDWGYRCIADALECSDAVFDCEIMAAREWLVVVGDQIRYGAVFEADGPAFRRKRDLWKREERMNLERWEFWRRRVRELTNKHGDGEVRRAAKMLEETLNELSMTAIFERGTEKKQRKKGKARLRPDYSIPRAGTAIVT